jgi:hypothetical protein
MMIGGVRRLEKIVPIKADQLTPTEFFAIENS